MCGVCVYNNNNSNDYVKLETWPGIHRLTLWGEGQLVLGQAGDFISHQELTSGWSGYEIVRIRSTDFSPGLFCTSPLILP